MNELLAADLEASVVDFNVKHRFPVGIEPLTNPANDLLRGHLINEELAEFQKALAERDVVKMADGIGDLLYVVVGAGIAYGIPAMRMLEEVCKSNDTKAVRKEGDSRLRDKGPNFREPDAMKVLLCYAEGWAKREAVRLVSEESAEEI